MSTTSTTSAPEWWVVIEREHGPDLAVGPYTDEAAATLALEESPLIDGFCEEDALDAYATDDAPADDIERVVIDPKDRTHHGRGGSDEPGRMSQERALTWAIFAINVLLGATPSAADMDAFDAEGAAALDALDHYRAVAMGAADDTEEG